ncbi:hypothetical protein JW905_03260 [bacterium]|nr:hypothetical protein [candidate division CSSED10-310 bacterium]
MAEICFKKTRAWESERVAPVLALLLPFVAYLTISLGLDRFPVQIITSLTVVLTGIFCIALHTGSPYHLHSRRLFAAAMVIQSLFLLRRMAPDAGPLSNPHTSPLFAASVILILGGLAIPRATGVQIRFPRARQLLFSGLVTAILFAAMSWLRTDRLAADSTTIVLIAGAWCAVTILLSQRWDMTTGYSPCWILLVLASLLAAAASSLIGYAPASFMLASILLFSLAVLVQFIHLMCTPTGAMVYSAELDEDAWCGIRNELAELLPEQEDLPRSAANDAQLKSPVTKSRTCISQLARTGAAASTKRRLPSSYVYERIESRRNAADITNEIVARMIRAPVHALTALRFELLESLVQPLGVRALGTMRYRPGHVMAEVRGIDCRPVCRLAISHGFPGSTVDQSWRLLTEEEITCYFPDWPDALPTRYLWLFPLPPFGDTRESLLIHSAHHLSDHELNFINTITVSWQGIGMYDRKIAMTERMRAMLSAYSSPLLEREKGGRRNGQDWLLGSARLGFPGCRLAYCRMRGGDTLEYIRIMPDGGAARSSGGILSLAVERLSFFNEIRSLNRGIEVRDLSEGPEWLKEIGIREGMKQALIIRMDDGIETTGVVLVGSGDIEDFSSSDVVVARLFQRLATGLRKYEKARMDLRRNRQDCIWLQNKLRFYNEMLESLRLHRKAMAEKLDLLRRWGHTS